VLSNRVIHRQLGGGIATLQWTVSAYTMAFGAGIITAAALGDRLGYVIGLAVFTAASAACALAPGAGWLIAFRAVQGIGASFIMSAAIFSAAFLTSQFFQFAAGDSPLGTGLRFLPWTATPLLVAPVAGAISDRVGARRLVVPGLVLQGAGFAWIVSLAGTSAGYASYIWPFVLAGTGISMALPCVTAAGLNAAPPALLGKASGTLNTLQQFGAVFGVAVVTAVFNSEGSLAGPAAVTSGYRPALAVAAGLSVLGAAAALGLGLGGRRRPALPAAARSGQQSAGALR
jgi:MFS family permease